ncbi:MAG: membrane integrity-associated transporter subunit PqiC [Burkholderiales bacterium]|nr:membrane integrity-associated transporter subunit PqiC [Burkholderiales bacterium]
MNRNAVLLAAALLTACSIGPRPSPPITTYDFGLARDEAERSEQLNAEASIGLAEITTPDWLDTPALHYRLAYLNPNARRAYADSRWAASPADLLTQRLRQRLAAAGAAPLTDQDRANADFTLRVQLEEFAQIFDAVNSSRALVRLHATLVENEKRREKRRGERGEISQRTFVVEKQSKTPDAEGAALALSAASDAAIAQLLDWLAPRLSDRETPLVGWLDGSALHANRHRVFNARVTPSPIGTSESSTP